MLCLSQSAFSQVIRPIDRSISPVAVGLKANGSVVGTVTVIGGKGPGVKIRLDIDGLAPGEHTADVHAKAACWGDWSFASLGEALPGGGTSFTVKANGRARVAFKVPGLTTRVQGWAEYSSDRHGGAKISNFSGDNPLMIFGKSLVVHMQDSRSMVIACAEIKIPRGSF